MCGVVTLFFLLCLVCVGGPGGGAGANQGGIDFVGGVIVVVFANPEQPSKITHSINLPSLTSSNIPNAHQVEFRAQRHDVGQIDYRPPAAAAASTGDGASIRYN